MPNYQETTDWLTMESLRLLTNSLEVSHFFNTSYNSEFTKAYPVGDTVRVPFPRQFIGRVDSDLSYQPQPIVDRHTTVTIDRVAKVHFEWDGIEAALKLPQGRAKISETILKPAMNKMRQDIDSSCAQWAYLNTPNVVGVLGTNPTTFDQVYGAAGQRMAELAVPAGERGMILTPGVARALRASAVAQFNPPDAISKMWKKGMIGEANGFDTYESMSLYSHTSGAWAGVVEILTAPASAGLTLPIPQTSTLSLTATTGDTFKAGDVVNIASVFEVNPMTYRSTGTLKQFVVQANVTAAASAASIVVYPAIIGPGSPYQNVDALPVAGADLTLFPGTNTSGVAATAKSGFQGLALTDQAFAIVGVRMEKPENVEMASITRDPDSGLAIHFVRAFDPVQYKYITRFDCPFGFGNLYADRAAIRIQGA